MLFRNLIISAFVALAAASDLAGRGEEPSPVRPTITSTTRVYITVRPTATGTGVPVAPKNGTSVTLPPIQSATGAGASNSVPVMVLGGAAAIAYALI